MKRFCCSTSSSSYSLLYRNNSRYVSPSLFRNERILTSTMLSPSYSCYSTSNEDQQQQQQQQQSPSVQNENKGFKHNLKTLLFVGVAASAGYFAYQMGGAKKGTKAPVEVAPNVSVDRQMKENEMNAAHTYDAPSSLNPNAFLSFPLREKKEISHDTRLFRFDLPSANHKLGLPVASCIVTQAPDTNGKPMFRPYTPISTDDQHGYFDLLIKVYPQGNMSQYIDKLKPGDTLEVKGPISKIPYTPNMKKRIGMLAGGTGITPMYQVITEVLKNPADKTEINLIFCNKSVDDILLKKELDELAATHSNFHVHYVVDKGPAGWTGGEGYVTPEMLTKQMPPPTQGEDILVMVCGPPGFYKHLSGDKTPDRQQGPLTGLLKELGYNESQVFKF